VLVILILYWNLFDSIEASKKYGPDAIKPPLYGIYDVQTFVKNNDTLAPLTTDTARWRKLIVSRPGISAIRLMNDSAKNYTFLPDTVAKRITMYSNSDTAKG